MKYQFPDAYGVSCRLVAIDTSFVPIIAGLLTELAEPGRWESDDDYTLAYSAIAGIVASMANDCALQITQSIDRLYMLMDSIYNGAVYEPVGGLPPALPVVPDAPPEGLEDGLRRQLRALQGSTPGGWFGIGAEPVTLAHVLEALRQGSEEDINLLDEVVGALDAADDASDIFNTVRGLITSAGSITLEGATLATIVASSMASAAMTGLQAAQIDEIRLQLVAIRELLTTPTGASSVGAVAVAVGEVRDLLTPDEYNPVEE